MIYIHAKNTVTFYEAPESIETSIHNLLMCRDDTDVGMGYDGDLTRPAYEQGLNDAWECARKIVCDCNYPNNHLRQSVLGGDTLVKFFTDNSASEAISKVKEYEENQKECITCKYNTNPAHSVCSSCINGDRYKYDNEIKVGDEIQIGYGESDKPKLVVTQLDGYYISAVDAEGDTYCFNKNNITLIKTGRRFQQIEEVLKQMKGE